MTKKTAVFIFLLVQYATFSLAQTQDSHLVVLQPGFRNVFFNQHVQQLKNPKPITALVEVIQANPSDFKQNELKQEVNFGYRQTDGWSKFMIKNESEKTDFFLTIQQSRIDYLQLFVQHGQLIDTLQMLGKNVPSYLRKIQSNDFVYKLSLKKGESITCFLYSHREFGHHACILNISDEASFTQYEHLFTFQLALVMGLTALAALFGLALFIFIKDKTYLYYGLYSVSYVFLFLADAGFIHSYFEYPALQFQINYATSITFFMSIGLHLLFTIELLDIHKVKYRWFYILGISSIVLFFSFTAMLVFFPMPAFLTWFIIYCSYYAFFFMDVYILIAILISLQQKQQITYFYLVGFLFTLIIGTIITMANIGMIDDINQQANYFYFTPVVEILILVLGFGFSFSNNMKEKYRFQKDIISTQENERKRIGQDLHDDVGNTLAAIKTVLSNRYPADNETNDMVQKAIANVRQISHNLMPVDFEKYQLSDILQQTLRKLDNKQIEVQFIEAGERRELKPATSLELYRIFNEIINNLYRHSKATEATIQLIYQEDSLVLSIEDNGKGFDLIKTLDETEGIGLKNLYARANSIGAKLTIQSDARGTLILLDLPINK
jgi:signal transduction histidine kinase